MRRQHADRAVVAQRSDPFNSLFEMRGFGELGRAGHRHLSISLFEMQMI